MVKMHGTHQKSNEEPLSYDEVLIVKVRVADTFFDKRANVFALPYRVPWR